MQEFYAALHDAAAGAHGPVVLVQLDAEALLLAARAIGESTALYFVQTNPTVLRRAFEAAQQAGISRPIAYFHGHTKDFVRDLPVRPALLAAPGAEDVFCFWEELPHNASLVMTHPLRDSSHWLTEGFVERHGACYRTTARFRTDAREIPAIVYQTVCAGLQAAYFGAAGKCRDDGYTPQPRITEPVRRWWQANDESAPGGYGEWPRVAPPTALPQTLPNGERWPLISVVTPSFNQGKYIEETILSVAAQGYPRVEHIVMDGGSTDETLAVIDRHRHRLAVAVSEKDRGQSNAINKGMACAKGDILTWLNSDDMLAPGALAAMGMAFYTSGADLVAGVVTLCSGGKTVGHHLTSCEPGPLPLDDLLDLDGGWNAGKFFYQPEVMFSREIWERAGGSVREDLFYSMDYDLWVRMARAGGRIHVIGHPIAWFRVHEEQKTNAEAKFKAELQHYVDEFHAREQRPKRPSKAHAEPRHHLRIALLNDHGFQYGAGIAHKRMAAALVMAGHSVTALSLRADPGYTAEPTGLTADEVATAVRQSAPNLVIAGNVHSAGPDPWQIGLLAEEFPTMAVLHDFWLFTGRCAYPTPCEKYRTGCDEQCPTWREYPKLEPGKIAGTWYRKQKLLFSDNQLMLFGNSAWTCQWARDAMAASGGGRTARPVEQFRLSFPLDVFRPRDRATCRGVLGLPLDRFIVMLSGDLYDPRKNTQLALDALESLQLPNLTIVSLGQNRPGEKFPFEDIRRPGHITDLETVAEYYGAADLYIAPSREETFGQVFIESIACGTPVVGVRASGMQEAVVDRLTGVLVDEFSTEALAAAILELYRRPELRRQMGQWGRIYVQNEWSPQAAYYHLFCAWRRLGLLEKLRMPEKIGFLPEESHLPQCQAIQPGEGLALDLGSLGPQEGPYAEYSLPLFRWAYGPVSQIKVHSNLAGAHSLVLRYRNVHPGQTLKLVLNDSPLGTFTLPNTGIDKGRLICVKAILNKGSNALSMEFSRWSDPAKEGRPMAAAITEIRFLPDPVH